ncbi:MAG TPA: GNAT family N-acetyltransferase [Bryobacteraceae bacterium]|nr:GNAT family N-acetyltransferase [Bryobacteraceae bacterium]
MGVKRISAPQFRNIEPLSAKHDKLRAAFSCGVEPLDRYLKQQARQDARRRVAAPYVLVSEDDRIAGYYTLSSDNFRADDLPPELVKQLKLPRYPVIGATLIGRLARDLSFRGWGVGELLLIDAVKIALAMSRKIASAAVVVDAKDDRAHRFYSEFGFIAFPETVNRLFLPMRTIEELFPEPAESPPNGEAGKINRLSVK